MQSTKLYDAKLWKKEKLCKISVYAVSFWMLFSLFSYLDKHTQTFDYTFIIKLKQTNGNFLIKIICLLSLNKEINC